MPFGLAVSLGPNFSRNALSTAFLSSRGFAHRRSVLLRAPIVAPKLAQPVTAADER